MVVVVVVVVDWCRPRGSVARRELELFSKASARYLKHCPMAHGRVLWFSFFTSRGYADLRIPSAEDFIV